MANVVLGWRRYRIERTTFKVCTLLTNYLADHVYHTLAGQASGELCLKYLFAFGAFTRRPLLERSVP
jgi:hypothetical protein